MNSYQHLPAQTRQKTDMFSLFHQVIENTKIFPLR